MSKTDDVQSPDDRAQETASQYPGPRKASSGEQVRPDPTEVTPPAGASAKEGTPAVAGRGGREGGATSGTASVPSAREHDDQSAATEPQPALPHRRDVDERP